MARRSAGEADPEAAQTWWSRDRSDPTWSSWGRDAEEVAQAAEKWAAWVVAGATEPLVIASGDAARSSNGRPDHHLSGRGGCSFYAPPVDAGLTRELKRHARGVRRLAKLVRGELELGDAARAAWLMHRLTLHLAAVAEAYTTRDHTLRGYKSMAAAQASGAKVRSARRADWAAWQIEAERVWQKAPALSTNAVATRVGRKFRDVSSETIRRRIKRP